MVAGTVSMFAPQRSGRCGGGDGGGDDDRQLRAGLQQDVLGHQVAGQGGLLAQPADGARHAGADPGEDGPQHRGEHRGAAPGQHVGDDPLLVDGEEHRDSRQLQHAPGRVEQARRRGPQPREQDLPPGVLHDQAGHDDAERDHRVRHDRRERHEQAEDDEHDAEGHAAEERQARRGARGAVELLVVGGGEAHADRGRGQRAEEADGHREDREDDREGAEAVIGGPVGDRDLHDEVVDAADHLVGDVPHAAGQARPAQRGEATHAPITPSCMPTTRSTVPALRHRGERRHPWCRTAGGTGPHPAGRPPASCRRRRRGC